MEWNLVKADPKRKKWTIRGTLWNGNTVKLPGHRDPKVAKKMMDNIASLSRSRMFGEMPDETLKPWIDGLPPDEADRYVNLGLLPRRLVEKDRPLEELLPQFLNYLKSECRAQSRFPREEVAKVRRVVETIGEHSTLKDLTKENVTLAVRKLIALTGRWKGKPLAQKTYRQYVFAMKSFCEWMVETERVDKTPLRKIDYPSAKGNPVRNRRPMPIEHFTKLADYLRHAPDRYPHQRYAWTPIDRLMIYWAAVMTGFRMKELRSLTRAHFDFDSEVARVTVEGWIAKNGHKATIPIPKEFAEQLNRYSAHLHPNAPLLRIPDPTSMTQCLYRDMDAAEVRRNFDDGSVVDFHTLRSTAIYWWVTVNKLHLLDVQCMARLKTLELVQDYVDNYAPDFKALVMNAPRIIDCDLPFKKAG